MGFPFLSTVGRRRTSLSHRAFVRAWSLAPPTARRRNAGCDFTVDLTMFETGLASDRISSTPKRRNSDILREIGDLSYLLTMPSYLSCPVLSCPRRGAVDKGSTQKSLNRDWSELKSYISNIFSEAPLSSSSSSSSHPVLFPSISHSRVN